MALNPIAFTERVVDDFLRYQLRTYPLADPGLEAQLRALLSMEDSHSTPLRKGPFVSLSRPFAAGATVEQLIEEGVFHPGMRSVVPYPGLRKHQEEAIRAVHAGKTTLVSTGTGSGKTEAFLYPIISRCLELEAQHAPPGVVAVILYPMNALAKDQLERLRGLLAGRGVSFGMYVGQTPARDDEVQGRLPTGSSNAAYKKALKARQDKGRGPEPRPPEERVSRAAMRAEGGQPRILLTNVKQLELLLTRGKDVGIFVRSPLEFIVFDEAHTFRGAQGAETACLVRRLRTFCGRSAGQVRHIATSATMADPSGGDDAARDFARRFFGVDAGRVCLVREAYDPLRFNEERSLPEVPSQASQAVLTQILDAVDAPEAEAAARLSAPLQALGGAKLPRVGWQQALRAQLASNELVKTLAELLHDPQALASLPEALKQALGRPVEEDEILCWLALGAASGRGGAEPLLRPVVHSFVRGVGGAVVNFSGADKRAQLWLSGEEAEAAQAEQDLECCSFPVLSCTTCGQHYYEGWAKDMVLPSKGACGGGEWVGHARVWPALPEASGGSRVLFVDRLVVRPGPDEVGETERTEDILPGGHELAHPRLVHSYVCRVCGSFTDTAAEACPACNKLDSLVEVNLLRQKEEQPGKLTACVACQARGKRPGGGSYREPARPLRAVTVADVHVLAQSMVHLSERKRLLVFADNRQDAAFQAGWMQDHARRFRLMADMAQCLPEEGGISVGELMHVLDARMDADDALSEALLPEVWRQVYKRDSQAKHQKERQFYLRVMILRELATGERQRLGLEPWGRIKVAYQGLDASMPFIQRWAPQLDCAPERLVEGVGALLDHFRRVRLLSDKIRLFETYWDESHREVQAGYIPAFSGGPHGMLLRRDPGHDKGATVAWLTEKGRTYARQLSGKWGVEKSAQEDLLTELWEALVQVGLLVDVQLKNRYNKTLKGTGGCYQIDAERLRIHRHSGLYRCGKCRKLSVRRGVNDRCPAYNCDGYLRAQPEPEDSFDLRILDEDYGMLRAAEHSAQVPDKVRARVEAEFKGSSSRLNTLVCTPTLELGVDIGALDSVLMRNVPPTAANYWQRAGRAGRRHRMAVDITYAQSTSFDLGYFREPLRLLRGQVEPPRFNLKNGKMIQKHLHATVLTTLHGIARGAPQGERERMQGILRTCFPVFLRGYLFDDEGDVMAQPLDVSVLGLLIAERRAELVAALEEAFHLSWPAEDAAATTMEVLEGYLDGMPDALQRVIARFSRRLRWALDQLERLAKLRGKKGALDPEDEAHERRCKKTISRLKGMGGRGRGQAEGMDSETMGALAREGFLPGYGLDAGAIIGDAEPPRFSMPPFRLPRPPTLALREFVPGNAIYANGHRFVPRRYQLAPEVASVGFTVNHERQLVRERGRAEGAAPLEKTDLRGLEICDVSLPAQSHISDEEEFRFQMPVSVYGYDRGAHRGGQAYRWGERELQLRHGAKLRLVNVGPRGQKQGGFLVCQACGQSQSPFSSKKAQEAFLDRHKEVCGQEVQPVAFYADVEVDLLELRDVRLYTEGYSLMESLRLGASRVLEMEVEDLQLLPLPRVDRDVTDLALYDPMPGGSGLLEQLILRWDRVVKEAETLLKGCASACKSSCIDCLQSYRNRFYHQHLDRHVAIEVFEQGAPLTEAHPIPEKRPATGGTVGLPQTWIEQRFLLYLQEAGLPDPECQHRLQTSFGPTIPDFFYELDDEDEPGIAIYLDGMAEHIHGNAQRQRTDNALREDLRSEGYEVVVLDSGALDDKKAVRLAILRIARVLEKDTQLIKEGAWFERAQQKSQDLPQSNLTLIQGGGQTTPRLPAGLVLVDPSPQDRNKTCVPLLPLSAAAGSFGPAQEPGDTEAWRWVQLPAPHRPAEGLFVAQIEGESMNRQLKSGVFCLWRAGAAPVGEGEVVLAELREGHDPELGGRYTVKRLFKEQGPDGPLLRLQPNSTDLSFKARRYGEGEGLVIVARLVAPLDGGEG